MCGGVGISMNARVGRSPLDSRLRGNDERDRNDGRDRNDEGDRDDEGDGNDGGDRDDERDRNDGRDRDDEGDGDDERDRDDEGWVFGLGAIRRARTSLEHEGGHRMLETQADAPDWRVRKIRC